MGVYNAKWVKCNLELRFGKNEDFKIYRINSEEGKVIWGNRKALKKNDTPGVIRWDASEVFRVSS